MKKFIVLLLLCSFAVFGFCISISNNPSTGTSIGMFPTFTSLEVTDTSTLNATSVTTLTTSGAVTVNSLAVTGTSALQAASVTTLTTSGAVTVNSLAVTGASALQATSVTTLTTSGAVTVNSLAVTGTSALQAASVTTLTTSGSVTINGVLNVPSGIIAGNSGYVLKEAVLPIGVWNMDSAARKTVTSSVLTGIGRANIVSISFVIHNDNRTVITTSGSHGTGQQVEGEMIVYIETIDSTGIVFERDETSAAYNNTDYNDATMNRGYIYIKYL